LKHTVANSSPGRAATLSAYIDVDGLELDVGPKVRAASMDHIGAKRRLMSANRNAKPLAMPSIGSALPQIGNVNKENAVRSGVAQPTIVLTFSEPLSEEQKTQHASLIDLFGLPIITCFISKSWSTRNTAI